jgi:hypothetical protein
MSGADNDRPHLNEMLTDLDIVKDVNARLGKNRVSFKLSYFLFSFSSRQRGLNYTVTLKKRN